MNPLMRVLARARYDLRYSLRSLGSSPGFTIAAVLTIALGVGINTGLFSVINSIAFRSVAGNAPEALIAVHQDVRGVARGRNNFAQYSVSEYERYRDQATSVSGLLAYGRLWMATLDQGQPQSTVATPVSCNYFDVLGIPAAVGRGLVAENCESAANARVAVITHSLWQNVYGGDPAILGQTVTVNGNDFEIVGVAPEGFAGIDIDRPSMFVPLAAQPILRPDRDYFQDDSIAWLNVVGRLAEDASIAQLEAEFGVIAAQFDQEQPGRTTVISAARATPMSAPEMRLAVFGAWGVLMAAFALVLLVACTNVANLMLARADTRMRETAIRLSLGATRARLIAQLLTESVLVSVAGGLAGALLAAAGFRVLIASVFSAMPADAGLLLRIEPVFDIRVFIFAFALSLLAGVGFGLAPALTATRPGLRSTMEQDSAAAGHHSRGRLRGVLVGVQVAFSMVLVIATALMLRALYEVRGVDPQFDHERLVVASADLRAYGYAAGDAAAIQQQALEGVRALPGVESVAQALLSPLEPRSRSYVFRRPEETQGSEIRINNVSSGYFDVTGIELVRGRGFTESETSLERSAAVILTESTARSFWPDEDPLGKTLMFEAFEVTAVEVVGIARDTEIAMIGETDTRYIYMPAVPIAQAESQLLIRTDLPASALADAIEAIYAAAAPRVPVSVRPLSYNFTYWSTISALAAALSFGLAVLALTLASIGVFGVMSTVVGRRIREIGIRLALGAARSDVLRLVLGKSLRPAFIGAGVGVLACIGIGRLLSSLLFGVSPLDPVALLGATLVVLAAAAAACILPARRALRVEPMTALRYE